MTTYCLIEAGVVTNRTIFDGDMPEGWAKDGSMWVADEDAQIGWSYDGASLKPPPPPPPLPPPNPLEQTATKRQINAALIVSGVSATPDAWMTELLGAIVDPTARALAINDWANAPFYERTAPLFNDEDLIAAAGLTSEQVDGLWALAVTLPA